MFSFLVFVEFVIVIMTVSLIILQKSSDSGIISMADSMKFSNPSVINFATKVTKILIVLFIINTIIIAKIGKFKHTEVKVSSVMIVKSSSYV